MIKGTYIFYIDGKEIYKSKNVITKFGKRFLTNFIAGNTPSTSRDIAIGIDTTTATENDTRLGFEFYRSPVVLSSTDIQTSGASTTYSVIYKTTIPQDVVGVVSEIGLYPSTRTTINNFDSKFLADFYDTLDWTTIAGNNSASSTTGARIGDNVLNFVTPLDTVMEYRSNVDLDFSGYSLADSITLAYYKNDDNLDKIRLKLYHTDNAWFYYDITPQSGVGYKITPDILLGDVFNNSGGA